MTSWINQIYRLQAQKDTFATATLVKVKGSAPQELGAKIIVLPDKTFLGTIGGGNLEQLVIQEALDCLNCGQNRTSSYPLGAKTAQCCGGMVDVLFEVFFPKKNVLVFGAGHIGQAFCQSVLKHKFEIHLFDHRPEWIHHASLPNSITTYTDLFDDLDKDQLIALSSNANILVWTHLHELDFEIVKFFLKYSNDFSSLGLIGSKTKWQRFKFRLKGQGISNELLDRVQSPIGLFKTTKHPAEIAQSVSADLLKEHYETHTIMRRQERQNGVPQGPTESWSANMA